MSRSGGSRREEESTTFDTGRYLYCVVDDSDAPSATLEEVRGVDDGEVRVVRAAGLAAVVQRCDSLFDSDDVDTIRRWLLRHQTVVDRAGDVFGTPLPFGFDTILQGDDAAVRTWLCDHETALSDALDTLAGTWEYRIEVSWDESTLADRLAADDDRLTDLRRTREAAGEGRSFLVQKQYDRRLAELLDVHRRETMDELRTRLRPLVDRLEDADRGTDTVALSSAPSEADDRLRSAVAVLARAEHESTVGERLEDFASRPGVEIRFTGPWPPYSFAPSFGGES